MLRYNVLLFLQGIIFAEAIFHHLSLERTKEIFISDGYDPGSPLFLTPYIELGKIDEAKQLARVTIPGLPDIESYAGFFTVDKTYNSNLFFWFFPAIQWKVQKSKPGNLTSAFSTFVWLQGGPGASSLYGLFEENGPIFVKSNTFQKRIYSWNQLSHLVYIDSPVGTGFSFTNDSRGYCTNQTQIGEHLYTALYQFYQMFPEMLHFRLAISGESYGGKYATALAKTIHEMNPKAEAQGRLVLPLQAMSIGDGWCDPINQLDYADFLYQTGLLDWNQRDTAKEYADKVREYIRNEEWSRATDAWKELISYLSDRMGSISMYNYVKVMTGGPEIVCHYCDLINTGQFRKSIHVGNLSYSYISDDVYDYLKEDFMKSVAPWISELLENYNVLFYNGQQDIITAYPLTINFVRRLNWSGSEDYEEASRSIIRLYDAQTEKIFQLGFTKTTSDGRLNEGILVNAGHMAPLDQPLWTLEFVMLWFNTT